MKGIFGHILDVYKRQVYGRHGTIKKIELIHVDGKYSKGDTAIKDTDIFLRKRLGAPDKKNLKGVRCV